MPGAAAAAAPCQKSQVSHLWRALSQWEAFRNRYLGKHRANGIILNPVRDKKQIQDAYAHATDNDPEDCWGWGLGSRGV